MTPIPLRYLTFAQMGSEPVTGAHSICLASSRADYTWRGRKLDPQ